MKYTVHSLDTEIEDLEIPGPWDVAFRVVARALILRARGFHGYLGYCMRLINLDNIATLLSSLCPI